MFHVQSLAVTVVVKGSITALADSLGVYRSYVRRILTLATLASDIVEVIVVGEEPSGLSLDTLMKWGADAVGGEAREVWVWGTVAPRAVNQCTR
jgi:hypothetical protein